MSIDWIVNCLPDEDFCFFTHAKPKLTAVVFTQGPFQICQSPSVCSNAIAPFFGLHQTLDTKPYVKLRCRPCTVPSPPESCQTEEWIGLNSGPGRNLNAAIHLWCSSCIRPCSSAWCCLSRFPAGRGPARQCPPRSSSRPDRYWHPLSCWVWKSWHPCDRSTCFNKSGRIVEHF